MATLSPMISQYLDIKQQHKDQILFFRLGDFYEMFFDDAINVSKELELTLTGKDCGMPERAPMCGIPYHSSEVYIKRLIDKGYKVAICEQVENPATAKGLVKREVVRIVTPGTVIESSLLSEESNNFIASVISQKNLFAICFVDISTGDVFLTQQKSNKGSMEIISELSKFLPSEILLNNNILSYKEVVDFIKNKLNCVCEIYSQEETDENLCLKTVLNHFKDKTIEQLNLTDKSLAVTALGSLINYIDKTQKNGAMRIVNVNFYKDDEYMGIDITAKRNLEITKTMRSGEKRGTLLWVLDKTKTSMGKRYIKKALEQPLISLTQITNRQNAIKELLANLQIQEEITSSLSNVYDIERLMTRVVYGTVNPREIRSLGCAISNLPNLKKLTDEFACTYLKSINENINTLEDVYSLIDNAISNEPPIAMKDGGVIKVGFNEELDGYRDLCLNAKEYIAKIEQREKIKTGIAKLKIGYNRVFGYYIEVTNSFLSQVPETYIRKQTLSNCERYITQELKDLEAKVLSANDKTLALEYEIFNEVRKFIAEKINVIQSTATAIAKLDFICSLTTVAYENNYVCPDITLDGKIIIKDGRHPVVEKIIDNSMFVPNDTNIDTASNKMMIITGPNMAGKSTYMRQVAIITIMAQIGSFVCATSASISICDKIFTRVGASDDLTSGQSTFMVEMSEVAHILKTATPQSLVILDEIGRGTSTFDGMSIAKAVVAHIVESKKLSCKTLFATHYHELTTMENEYAGIKNYNIAVKKRGDDITFLRKIVRGGADESFGIEVAKLAGVPQVVVDKAKEILATLESQPKNVLSKIRNDVDDLIPQITFTQQNNNNIIDKLSALQIETLTPIEALNILYDLKKSI